MLAVRLPGASAPKMACIMFVSWLIGPQFVSPSTRRPTSISGSDSRMATAVSQMAMPRRQLLHDDQRDRQHDHADDDPLQRKRRDVGAGAATAARTSASGCSSAAPAR